MLPIYFLTQDVDFKLVRPTNLRRWLASQIEAHGRCLVSMNYIFCTDDYLLQLNRAYLQHDSFTDIITFDLSSAPDQLEGEAYISLTRVTANAQRYEAPFYQELCRVLVHGILHLVGFRDKSPAEKKAMRLAEEKAITHPLAVAYLHHRKVLLSKGL